MNRIANTQQKVDQKSYGESYDRIWGKNNEPENKLPGNVKFVWWDKTGAPEHEESFAVGRTTRGLKWKDRRPDYFEVSLDAPDDVPQHVYHMWKMTLANG